MTASTYLLIAGDEKPRRLLAVAQALLPVHKQSTGRSACATGCFPRYKASGPVRRHLAAGLGDGLAYREAFTTTAAQAVVAHLVNDRGLQLDQGAERSPRRPLPDALDPGKIVFVYHQTRDTGYGARETDAGVGDSGLGIRDSGKVGAAQGAPQPARPEVRRLAA